jgi:hypothetical protein
MVAVKTLRGYVRRVAVLVLLAVASATAPHGYCMMNRASTTQGADDQRTHDCCGKGIGATPPACCHSDMTIGPTVVLGSQSKAIVLASIPATWIAPVLVPEADRIAASAHRPHSPPLTILRI